MRSGKWARRSLSGGRSSGTPPPPPDSMVARQRSIASSCDAAYDTVALGGTVRAGSYTEALRRAGATATRFGGPGRPAAAMGAPAPPCASGGKAQLPVQQGGLPSRRGRAATRPGGRTLSQLKRGLSPQVARGAESKPGGGGQGARSWGSWVLRAVALSRHAAGKGRRGRAICQDIPEWDVSIDVASVRQRECKQARTESMRGCKRDEGGPANTGPLPGRRPRPG